MGVDFQIRKTWRLKGKSHTRLQDTAGDKVNRDRDSEKLPFLISIPYNLRSERQEVLCS